jgi:hypothetical protein
MKELIFSNIFHKKYIFIDYSLMCHSDDLAVLGDGYCNDHHLQRYFQRPLLLWTKISC